MYYAKYALFIKWNFIDLYFFKSLRQVCEQFLQLRGIVYPKWTKDKVDDGDNSTTQTKSDNISDTYQDESTDENQQKSKIKKPKCKWRIEGYAYSFSKHVKNPKSIQISTKNAKDNFKNHVQNCPFKVTRVITKKFRIFPPFNTEKKSEN